MSSWEIYWIVKLDDIQSALVGAGAIGLTLCAFAILAIWFLMLLEGAPLAKQIKKLIAVAALFLCVAIAGVLTPTTKQAAAIYIVPSLTTDESMARLQTESSEIYDLFKQWLHEQVATDTPTD